MTCNACTLVTVWILCTFRIIFSIHLSQAKAKSSCYDVSHNHDNDSLNSALKAIASLILSIVTPCLSYNMNLPAYLGSLLVKTMLLSGCYDRFFFRLSLSHALHQGFLQNLTRSKHFYCAQRSASHSGPWTACSVTLVRRLSVEQKRVNNGEEEEGYTIARMQARTHTHTLRVYKSCCYSESAAAIIRA